MDAEAEGAMKIEIEAPAVFKPLVQPARFKGAHGGRGGAKSWFFAALVVAECLRRPGLRVVCAREFQKTLAESAKRLLEDSIQRMGVGHLFNVQHDKIQAPGGGVITFWGLADQNAQSIKSLEGTDICWTEEAQTLSQRSLALLRPTIRAEGSELWFSWNPTRKVDAVDVFLRQNTPPGAIVVEANWRDNPFFPGVLDEERRLDLERYPDRYPHIWEGDYARAFEGAMLKFSARRGSRTGSGP
jgi:phage terminase large subunit